MNGERLRAFRRRFYTCRWPEPSLLVPRLLALEEWAYAGFTFTWIPATAAHNLADDGFVTLMPVVLLGSLTVSYVTRSTNRGGPRDAAAGGSTAARPGSKLNPTNDTGKAPLAKLKAK